MAQIPPVLGVQIRVVVRFGGAVGFRQFGDLGAAVAFVMAWHSSPWVFLAEVGQALLGERVVDRIGEELS